MNKLDELKKITKDYYARLKEVHKMLESIKQSLPAKDNWWEDNFPYSVYRDNIDCVQRLLNSLIDVTLEAHRQAIAFAQKEAKYEKTCEKID